MIWTSAGAVVANSLVLLLLPLNVDETIDDNDDGGVVAGGGREPNFESGDLGLLGVRSRSRLRVRKRRDMAGGW